MLLVYDPGALQALNEEKKALIFKSSRLQRGILREGASDAEVLALKKEYEQGLARVREINREMRQI